MLKPNSKILGVIPARYGSTRLPGKPLVDICGKTMIRRVYEGASVCKDIDRIVVATDDKRIYDEVLRFGGECMITGAHHKSGTSRLCEVAQKFNGYDFYINIQGDQPFIDGKTLYEICSATELLSKEAAVATLVCQLKEEEENDVTIPKVVVDKEGRALYFSRFPIPFDIELGRFNPNNYLKHLGVYGFTKNALIAIEGLEQSHLERAESLEQLTWLYEQIPVYTSTGSDINKVSIDTEEDLKSAIKMIKEKAL
tara:strand:- start:37506 stop:38267 length:762 start_codon:yes stop_codon:yes gene_type:complete